MKLLKRVRRGEPWYRGGETNTGESSSCVGISTEADRFEAFAGLRNDKGDDLGDVGALEGPEEVV